MSGAPGASWAIAWVRRRVFRRSPQRALPAIQGGLLMLRLNKRILGAAGAVVAAASLAVTGITAASARSSAVTGTEKFQLMTTSATATTVPVIAYGVFTKAGVSHTGSKVDTLVFSNGSFKVNH